MSIWRDYYDVVILPPRDAWKHAIALSKELRRHGGTFVLGNRRNMPHISLYHIPVLKKDLSDFKGAVRRAAAAAPGGDLRLRSVDMPVLMTDKPAWLRRLQREIVHATLPCLDRNYGVEKLWRTDMLPPDLKTEAKEYLHKYGSPMMGRVFRPHITLTSFGKNRKIDGIRLEFERLKFSVDEIAICELGPHHTCQRTIVRYPLAGK